MMNFQIQITKRQGVTPMTRDYIGETEDALHAAETKRQTPFRLAGE
jgi:cyclopropane-fatty-acyl-phospholipid synthase